MSYNSSTTPPRPQPGTATGNTSATNAPRPMPRTGNSARDMSQSEFEAKMKELGIRL